MDNYLSKRTNYVQRIIIFFCSLIFCLLITTLITSLFYKCINAVDARIVRISLIIQDLIVFILPVLITSVIISTNPIRFLRLGKAPGIRYLLLLIVVIVVSTPAMNWLVEWNKSITFPSSMHALEQWLVSNEESATSITNLLLSNLTIPSLIVSILIIGVFTGFSEELFFRGMLQRIFATRPMNIHLAIWSVAFFFSLFHFQFFGFFPRFILGAFFGYLLLWSGSIWVPIIAHTLNNSTVVITSYIYGLDGVNKIDLIGVTDGGFPYVAVISAILTVCIISFFVIYENKERNKMVG